MRVNLGAAAPPYGPVLDPEPLPQGTVRHTAGVSVAVATLDANGTVIAAGGALAELADVAVGELFDLGLASFFVAEDQPSLVLALDRCRSGIASWVQVRSVRPTGAAPLWLRLEPLVVAPNGTSVRIGVAVLRAPASWQPSIPVEIPPPLRAAIDELRRGLDQGQFQLHYQPIIDLEQPCVVGVEALLRWQHPTAGLLLPAHFLPVAEVAGLTGELTAHVLREACAHASRWSDWRVSVNLFPADLRSASIVDRVSDALDASGLPAHRLSLEVTEESLGEHPEASLAVLRELRDLGVRLSLDDFGTGHSSLLYLRDYPVTELKIDREFVAGISRSPDDRAIVSSVLSLAVTLGLEVVAVGVQTAPQLNMLRVLGCDLVQGFLFSPPMSADEVDALHAEPEAFLAPSGIPPGLSLDPVSLSQVDGIGDDPVTATIADLQLQGASLHTIAAALNQSGQRTSDGKRWTAAAVAALIHALTRHGPPRRRSRRPQGPAWEL